MPKRLATIDRAVLLVEDFVSAASLAAIVLLVIGQVFFRYVLESGLIWMDEVVTILMVAMVMFGCGAATRRLLHTELLVFVDMMPGRVRRVVRASTSLIGLAFLLLFFYSAAEYTLGSQGMVTTVLRIPIQYVYALLPVGAALTLYEYLKTMPASFRERPDLPRATAAKDEGVTA
jgi:TRAP-type C4-dicarboxylate transport system permease small subunit